jgi:hypothetical protein
LSQHRLFYQNKQLELYAAKEANRLTLRQLVSYLNATTHLVVTALW